MTDLEACYDDIQEVFDNPKELNNAIDLLKMESVPFRTMMKVPELERFFGGEDEALADSLEKGLRSLRKGYFYKLCGDVSYRQDIFPNTFAAAVYCLNLGDNRMIKYFANIGPMTNSHSGYSELIDTLAVDKISVWQKYLAERSEEDPPIEYYYQPKKNFFERLLESQKVFYVITSEFDPAFPDVRPKPKKVVWSFIEH